jgi:hypothetical protein
MLRSMLSAAPLVCFAICTAGCHSARPVPPNEIGSDANLCIRAVTTRQGEVVKFSTDPRRPCPESQDGKIVGRLRDGSSYEIPLSDVEEVHGLSRDKLRREREVGIAVAYLFLVATVGIAVAFFYGVSTGGLS